MAWHKQSLYWVDNGDLFVSIPFTWELPKVAKSIGFYERVYVGGPAVDLMPYYFAEYPNVEAGGSFSPGLLQRMNPQATRTTLGCPNHCKYCGIGRGLIEPGGLVELEDWLDLPMICDNNLLAASQSHFDKVMDRLERWQWADFDQGLDARLLTDYHAERFARLKKPMIRLALDGRGELEQWFLAFEKLRVAGIAKANIRSYALIGFNSDPDEAWHRCDLLEWNGVKPLPMWYHSLDALQRNVVTEEQQNLGWNDYERKRIMQWFYHHKKAVVSR